jgi:hypothetical protein
MEMWRDTCANGVSLRDIELTLYRLGKQIGDRQRHCL